MVCLYCGSPTAVINSRQQHRSNGVWRRRRCAVCRHVFTSIEQADMGGSLRVARSPHELVVFNRDQLFVSIYNSCKHRPQALIESANLTQQVISSLQKNTATPGLVTREQLVGATHYVLKTFDAVAATFYAAYHPL